MAADLILFVALCTVALVIIGLALRDMFFSAPMQFKAGPVSIFSEVELDQFRHLVATFGQVDARDLVQRIKVAERLCMISANLSIAGTSALKRPNESYLAKVEIDTGVNLAGHPFELGWIVVAPDFRRRGLSRQLVQKVLAGRKWPGIFATTSNSHMKSVLKRYGFQKAGRSYPSKLNSGELIELWLRDASS